MRNFILIVLTFVCSYFVLKADAHLGRFIVHAYKSLHYPSVKGKVTRSDVEPYIEAKGAKIYEAVIAYGYSLHGQAFASSQTYSNPRSPSDEGWAKVVAGRYPAGSTLDVFYNPADPTDSTLSPSFDGTTLAPVLLFTPFHAVMFGCWVWLGGLLMRRRANLIAGGIQVFRQGTVTRIRLPDLGAAGWGLGVLGVFGLVATVIVSYAPLQSSIGFVLAFIAAVYLAAAAAFFWKRAQIASGMDDLIINKGAGTLDLPQTFGRMQRITTSLGDIKGLAVKRVVHRNPRSGFQTFSYAPTIALGSINPPEQRIADWRNKAKADAFTYWLRIELGL